MVFTIFSFKFHIKIKFCSIISFLSSVGYFSIYSLTNRIVSSLPKMQRGSPTSDLIGTGVSANLASSLSCLAKATENDVLWLSAIAFALIRKSLLLLRTH